MKKARSKVDDNNKGRVLCAWLGLRGRTPVRLNAICLRSNNWEDAFRLGEAMLEECAENCDDNMIVGDWNRLAVIH